VILPLVLKQYGIIEIRWAVPPCQEISDPAGNLLFKLGPVSLEEQVGSPSGPSDFVGLIGKRVDSFSNQRPLLSTSDSSPL
jgi:hypothetical protein